MAKKSKYPVVLSDEEISALRRICRKGKHNARTILRCRVLLAAHQGLEDKEISTREGVGRTTPLDIRKRYREGGLERAIHDAPRSGRPHRLEQNESLRVVAIACSDPPDGRECWTISLITEEVIEKTSKQVSKSTIGRVLLENSIKPWREKNVVRPRAE